MAPRRILSLWFPRLAAERALRHAPDPCAALAVVAEEGAARLLSSLSTAASAAGLFPGQPLRDAFAICPDLLTRPADPPGEAAFLDALRRRAGRFSPKVAAAPPDGLDADITGVAHLFGGEAAMARAAMAEAAGLGLSLRIGIADTPGAARALARWAGGGTAIYAPEGTDSDAIAEDARATRARGARRSAIAPRQRQPGGGPATPDAGIAIAPPGEIYGPLAPLPVAALGLPDDITAGLARLGLRRIGDIAGLPRASLTRRFGPDPLARLDRALGRVPEPIAPPPPGPRFALRLGLPEPIGSMADILAGLDRLLDPLCARLTAAGQGAREVRFELFRVEGGAACCDIRLARPGADAKAIRGLLRLRLDGLDAGFGFDALRLSVPLSEPISLRQAAGHLAAAARMADQVDRTDRAGAVTDLVARIGTRIGDGAMTWHHPANSHIPEKTAHAVAALWAVPAPPGAWPRPSAPRPVRLFGPEPVVAPADPGPPLRFRWRQQDFTTCAAAGPERIAPEWWLDEPAWRSGPRDYWRITTEQGPRLWLFFAHGGTMPGGWFCHGMFG